MKKISNYFYIFTKLSTSFVLFFLLITVGYALYQSYEGVDSVAINFEKKIQTLQSEINFDKIKFTDLELLVKQNNTLLNDISNEILKNKENLKLLEITKNNNFLIDEITNLKNQISDIVNSTYNNKEKLNDNNISQLNNIKSIKNLIILKYGSGERIYKEIILLERLSKETPSNIFEKLYLIEQNKFFGKLNLLKEFDVATENYVKFKFLENNQNSVIKFLLRYVKIKPNNLSIYESEDLNILFRSKKNLELEEYKNSLEHILSLDSHQDYFDKWIKQVNLYLDFTSTLSKVF